MAKATRSTRGITSTSQIPRHFLDASPICFHFGALLFRVAGTPPLPLEHPLGYGPAFFTLAAEPSAALNSRLLSVTVRGVA